MRHRHCTHPASTSDALADRVSALDRRYEKSPNFQDWNLHVRIRDNCHCCRSSKNSVFLTKMDSSVTNISAHSRASSALYASTLDGSHVHRESFDDRIKQWRQWLYGTDWEGRRYSMGRTLLDWGKMKRQNDFCWVFWFVWFIWKEVALLIAKSNIFFFINSKMSRWNS